MSKSSLTTLTEKHGLHSKDKEHKPSLFEKGMLLRLLEFLIKTNDPQPVREEKGMGEGISSKS